MKIQKSLKIEINQADVEKAVRALIAQEDPTIVVDEITFAAKRSGKDAISVKVDAHFGEIEITEPTVTPPVEEVVTSVPEITDDMNKEDEAPFEGDPLPESAPPLETKVEEQPSPKQSLFG
ncbi:hypothetical protein PYDG_00078 [Pseudoalteromonas phage pYD6-A]|uniref:Uncharacterized protein n=1 Tax=Pseudoalteromonas phage pYD6-A TaxID=754052 RepID=M4SML0_9CAUD|nr:hypothetical protein PYDG_00078 [Pseudoalteromonas phage pYD6-A]AGH57607.1 hypothetical protein PYDG_00078 [Pseudoalteromonas phage pYD6-A]